MNRLAFITGWVVLFSAEILRVYFIMPFPGSQQSNTIAVAYFLNKYIWFIRLFAILLIVMATWNFWNRWKLWNKLWFLFGLVIYLVLFYMVNFRFLADKMFYQPKNKLLVTRQANKVGKEKLVVGVIINNDPRAYPIEIIGYHHQVQDTVGGKPIIVTYCTVCRTGRVFSPDIHGSPEHFRLVGMDHYNAMFEDSKTQSWWRQATGEAVAGPLKGNTLIELPSEQMRLGSWLRSHPNSLILQPDPIYSKRYNDLSGFDLGTIRSGLERRDSGSWKPKSWVVGIQMDHEARAYDWNALLQKRWIEDQVGGIPVIIFMEADQASFHVWDRRTNGQTLNFAATENGLKDMNTGSDWNADGLCVNGSLKGRQLKIVQSSQEFWHAWKQFHPKTTIYK